MLTHIQCLQRNCDSRNLALSPLCALEGLQSLAWLDDAKAIYTSSGKRDLKFVKCLLYFILEKSGNFVFISSGVETPNFLAEKEGRLGKVQGQYL